MIELRTNGTVPNMFGYYDDSPNRINRATHFDQEIERLRREHAQQQLQGAIVKDLGKDMETDKTTKQVTLQITSAENGFLINCNGSMFVYPTLDEMAAAIPGILLRMRLIKTT